jgi:hypothetical protein
MTGRTKPVGLFVGLLSNIALGWGIYHLLEIGNCGGQYPPCPASAAPYFLALIGGILGSIVAIFLGGGIFAFTGIFASIGLASLLRAANGGVQGDTTFPLIFGACFAGSSLIPLFLGGLAGRTRQRAAKLVAQGKRGVGTVMSVQDTGVTINNNPRVQLRMRIEPQDGSPAFEAEKAITVSRVSVPRTGDRFPVFYDPAEPSNFGLGVGLEAGAAPDVRALFAQAAAARADASAPPATPPAAGGDWVDELARLNQLRLSGALSDEEFAAAKSKLLSPSGGSAS